MHLRGLDFDTIEHVGPNPFMDKYTGLVPAERRKNIQARNAQTKTHVLQWKQAVSAKWDRDGCPYAPLGLDRREAFWRALVWNADVDRHLVPSAHARYFDAWLGRADVDATSCSTAARNADRDADAEAEARRLFVKPFTDCCIPRTHGRSFLVTRTGYIGLAPLRTRVGDRLAVLQGGDVPFVVRPRRAAAGEERGAAAGTTRCEFVGEAYVLGIMEGQVVAQAREDDVEVFVLT